MAKAKKKSQHSAVEWNLPLVKQNYVILLIGLGTILVGYALMATGITETPAVTDGKWNNFFAVNVAPTLLLIGYCVIIPFGLIKFFGKNTADTEK